jgi:hypothetical protein
MRSYRSLTEDHGSLPIAADSRGENVTKNSEEDLLHGALTRTIIGAAYASHTQLGEGFLEQVIEVKADKPIDQTARTQPYNYLRVSGLHVGLVINFSARVEFKRVICTARPLGVAIASRSV